jgi:hypothetical protein
MTHVRNAIALSLVIVAGATVGPASAQPAELARSSFTLVARTDVAPDGRVYVLIRVVLAPLPRRERAA